MNHPDCPGRLRETIEYMRERLLFRDQRHGSLRQRGCLTARHRIQSNAGIMKFGQELHRVAEWRVREAHVSLFAEPSNHLVAPPAIREFRRDSLVDRREHCGLRFRFRRLSRNLRVLCDDDE